MLPIKNRPILISDWAVLIPLLFVFSVSRRLIHICIGFRLPTSKIYHPVDYKTLVVMFNTNSFNDSAR